MNLWIRTDAGMKEDPTTAALAVALYPDAPPYALAAAAGHITFFYCAVAVHRPHGNVADVPPFLLCRWADWSGDPGRFVEALRTIVLDQDGRVREWEERQGKLLEYREREREKKRRQRAEKSASPGQSPGLPELQDRTNGTNETNDPTASPTVRDAFARHVLAIGGTLEIVAAMQDAATRSGRTADEIEKAMLDFIGKVKSGPSVSRFESYLAHAGPRPEKKTAKDSPRRYRWSRYTDAEVEAMAANIS